MSDSDDALRRELEEWRRLGNKLILLECSPAMPEKKKIGLLAAAKKAYQIRKKYKEKGDVDG